MLSPEHRQATEKRHHDDGTNTTTIYVVPDTQVIVNQDGVCMHTFTVPSSTLSSGYRSTLALIFKIKKIYFKDLDASAQYQIGLKTCHGSVEDCSAGWAHPCSTLAPPSP